MLKAAQDINLFVLLLGEVKLVTSSTANIFQ